MKKILAIFLSIVFMLSLIACSDKAQDFAESSEEVTTENKGLDVEPEVFQGVSNDRFSDSELLTITHKDGSVMLDSGYMAYFGGDGAVKITTFDSEAGDEFADASAPFGVKVGDSADDFINAFSIDPEFAIFVDSNGKDHHFSEGDKVDVPEGGRGYIYLGYGKDGDEWAFFDHQMLKSVIMGNAIIMDADKFPVVLYSCFLDENEQIIEMYEFHGDLQIVMSYIAG